MYGILSGESPCPPRGKALPDAVILLSASIKQVSYQWYVTQSGTNQHCIGRLSRDHTCAPRLVPSCLPCYSDQIYGERSTCQAPFALLHLDSVKWHYTSRLTVPLCRDATHAVQRRYFRLANHLCWLLEIQDALRLRFSTRTDEVVVRDRGARRDLEIRQQDISYGVHRCMCDKQGKDCPNQIYHHHPLGVSDDLPQGCREQLTLCTSSIYPKSQSVTGRAHHLQHSFSSQTAFAGGVWVRMALIISFHLLRLDRTYVPPRPQGEAKHLEQDYATWRQVH